MPDRTSGRPAASGGRPFASPTAGTTRPALSSSPRGSGHRCPRCSRPARRSSSRSTSPRRRRRAGTRSSSTSSTSTCAGSVASCRSRWTSGRRSASRSSAWTRTPRLRSPPVSPRSPRTSARCCSPRHRARRQRPGAMPPARTRGRTSSARQRHAAVCARPPERSSGPRRSSETPGSSASVPVRAWPRRPAPPSWRRCTAPTRSSWPARRAARRARGAPAACGTARGADAGARDDRPRPHG